MLTQEQIKQNISDLQQQGASDADIQSYLDSLKTSQTTPSDTKTPHTGFVQSVVQGLAHLPLQFAASIKGLGADLSSLSTLHRDESTGKIMYTPSQEADKIRNEGADYGYFGNVKPLGGGNDIFTGEGAGKAIKSGVGSALEGASYFVGGGEVAGVNKTLAQLAKQGAKEGAGIGALFGAGESLQNDENWLDTTLHTIAGAATGAGLGAVGGVAIPKAASFLKGIGQNISEKGVQEGLGQTIDDVASQFTKADKPNVKKSMVSEKPTLNIGMNVGNETKLTPEMIKKELSNFGVSVKNYNVVQSETEPTFIPELSRPLTKEELYSLSEKLQQDAIAQHDGKVGMLEGPKAQEWGGEFNPDYYLSQTGEKFSELASKAKPEEVSTLTIPKDIKSGVDKGGDVIAELEGMKGVGFSKMDDKQREAVMERIQNGTFRYKPRNTPEGTVIDFKPMIEDMAKETKDYAQQQDKLISDQYNKSFSKKEIEKYILDQRSKGVNEFGTQDSKDFKKALADELKNQELTKMTSAKDILKKVRSLKFDPGADSAKRQAIDDIKIGLTNLLKDNYKGFGELQNEMHKNFLVLDSLNSGIAKPGESIEQKIGAMGAAILSAPQGIVASFTARNLARKSLSAIFGGTAPLDKALLAYAEKSKPIIDKWTELGVSPQNIYKLIHEKYAYGKPTPETVFKIIADIDSSAQKTIKSQAEDTAKKLAEQKSLIRIIKGLGEDAKSIKEELANQGINASDADAKTFASLNKNSGKSLTPYLEKLAKLGLIEGAITEEQQ